MKKAFLENTLDFNDLNLATLERFSCFPLSNVCRVELYVARVAELNLTLRSIILLVHS